MVHPGKDDLIRVVSLRTKKGIFKRPVAKLSPFPVEIKYEEVIEEDLKAEDYAKDNGKITEKEPSEEKENRSRSEQNAKQWSERARVTSVQTSHDHIIDTALAPSVVFSFRSS